MTIGKLYLAALLGVIPSVAVAQPSIGVDVGVNVGADAYDTDAPGEPVESTDVFYDQLSPYGTWVDEPDVGRVYVPESADYVPYRDGHWQYTNLGFVWVSSEPHAWATSHYGRWAYSNHYARWYWLPDTTWGPAWVEWRQTGTHFGWAPLAPEVVVRAGWHPPAESWHYCGAEHVLDVNVGRYYEPRERVIEIHREARPLDHYSTVGHARVVVGPPAATLRDHRITVRPVRVEARTIGRWAPGEAHAQVEHAREHRATFEAQNQHRIDNDAKLHAAHVKVIETHPQLKVQVNARVEIARHPGEPSGRAEAGGRVEVEHGRPGEPEHGAPRPPEHVQPSHEAKPPEHAPPHEAKPPEHAPPHEARPPEHVQPPHEARPPEHVQPPHEAKPPERAPPQREHNAPPANHAPPPAQAPAPKPATQPPHGGDHRDDHKGDHR